MTGLGILCAQRPVWAGLMRVACVVLAKRRQWTQGAFARDATGRTCVHVDAGDAAKFCLVGAARRIRPRPSPVHGSSHRTEVEHQLRRATGAAPGEAYAWNDKPGRTFAEVQHVQRKAIARAWVEGV